MLTRINLRMDTLDTKIKYVIGTLLVIEYNRELKNLAHDLKYKFRLPVKLPHSAKIDLKRVLSQIPGDNKAYYDIIDQVLSHPDITLNLINDVSILKNRFITKYDIYSFMINCNCSIKIDDIYKNPDILDSYPDAILKCTDITWDIIKQEPYKYFTKPGAWMAWYHWFCWDIVLQYPEVQWDWKNISRHKNITWDIILENDTNPNWIRKSIAMNPNVTWDIVQANPERPWNISKLSGNPNITMEIVLENPEKPWDYKQLSGNPSLLWDDIRKNPGKPWDWYALFNNEYTIQSKLILNKHRKRVNQRINFMNRYITLLTIKTALDHYKFIVLTENSNNY